MIDPRHQAGHQVAALGVASNAADAGGAISVSLHSYQEHTTMRKADLKPRGNYIVRIDGERCVCRVDKISARVVTIRNLTTGGVHTLRSCRTILQPATKRDVARAVGKQTGTRPATSRPAIGKRSKKRPPGMSPRSAQQLGRKRGAYRARSKMSVLRAAAVVLKDAKHPMPCHMMIREMARRNLWTSTAKKPEQTLSSAIARDMKSKGNKSAFRRDRWGGAFAYNEPAK